MIKKILSRKIDSITIAATLVAFSSLLSRLLGILRDRILAGEFGAGNILDVYYAAFRVPDLIFNLIVLGALSAGFIPVFTCLIKDFKCERTDGSPNQKAWDLANNILNTLMIFLIFISGLGILFSPFLMKLVAPGFSPEKQQLTAELTRIMFLSPIFLGLSSILGGILQSFKRFLVYSLAPIMYNIGIIIGALYFVPFWGVHGLAWGVALGAFLHMFVQLPLVFSLGFKYRPIINLRDPNMRKIGRMMVPRTMTLGVSQLNLLVITILASGLAGGSLAVFNFANNLQAFPVGIFGISFAIAAFPTMSRVAHSKKKLIANFSATFRKILFFVVPATVLLITLRAQIIRVILGTGRFDWQDTILTMDTLGFFAIGLFAQATIPLLIRVFYARHDSKTPFFIGLAAAICNLVFGWYFSRMMGVQGLALGFSIAQIVNFVLLWLALHVHLGEIQERKILISVAKFSFAAIACGLMVQIMKLAVWPLIDMTKLWGVFTQGAAAGLSGIIIYIIVCFALRTEELFNIWSSFSKRLPWRKVETGDQSEARGL